MIKGNRVNKWIDLINKKYNTKFENIDSKDTISYKAFKNGKKQAYLQILINEFETVNLENFQTWYGTIDFIKLDAKFHNALILKDIKDLYNLSGIEKAKMILKKNEFDLLRKFLTL